MEHMQVTPVTTVKNRKYSGYQRGSGDRQGQRLFSAVLDELAAEPVSRHREDGFGQHRQGRQEDDAPRHPAPVPAEKPKITRLNEEQLSLLLSLSI